MYVLRSHAHLRRTTPSSEGFHHLMPVPQTPTPSLLAQRGPFLGLILLKYQEVGTFQIIRPLLVRKDMTPQANKFSLLNAANYSSVWPHMASLPCIQSFRFTGVEAHFTWFYVAEIFRRGPNLSCYCCLLLFLFLLGK